MTNLPDSITRSGVSPMDGCTLIMQALDKLGEAQQKVDHVDTTDWGILCGVSLSDSLRAYADATGNVEAKATAHRVQQGYLVKTRAVQTKIGKLRLWAVL